MALVKLAIMGGAFNPIHIGHLACAEEAVSHFGLDEVIFMPTGLAPHKQTGSVSSEERYEMAVIATASNPRFEVSRYEIDQNRVCYTVDTLRHFRAEKPSAELFFITGTDAVAEILQWKEPDEILRLATLIAARRPGYSLEQMPAETRRFLQQERVRIMEIPCIDVSSSLIRKRVSQEKSIRYLVPEGVEKFIEKERLYLQEQPQA